VISRRLCFLLPGRHARADPEKWNGFPRFHEPLNLFYFLIVRQAHAISCGQTLSTPTHDTLEAIARVVLVTNPGTRAMAIKFYDLSGMNARRFSPFGWRVRMALAHKKLDASVELIGFSDKAKLNFSGQNLVPVLVDGATVVADSWEISRHLEATYPDRPSLFHGAAGAAYARFVAAYTDSQLHPLVARCVVRDILEVIPEQEHAYFRADREKRFGMALEKKLSTRSEQSCATTLSSVAPAPALPTTRCSAPSCGPEVSVPSPCSTPMTPCMLGANACLTCSTPCRASKPVFQSDINDESK
jgi:hypothetical protein